MDSNTKEIVTIIEPRFFLFIRNYSQISPKLQPIQLPKAYPKVQIALKCLVSSNRTLESSTSLRLDLWKLPFIPPLLYPAVPNYRYLANLSTSSLLVPCVEKD